MEKNIKSLLIPFHILLALALQRQSSADVLYQTMTIGPSYVNAADGGSMPSKYYTRGTFLVMVVADIAVPQQLLADGFGITNFVNRVFAGVGRGPYSWAVVSNDWSAVEAHLNAWLPRLSEKKYGTNSTIHFIKLKELLIQRDALEYMRKSGRNKQEDMDRE